MARSRRDKLELKHHGRQRELSPIFLAGATGGGTARGSLLILMLPISGSRGSMLDARFSLRHTAQSFLSMVDHD